MAWKLFGHATTPAQLPAELRSILAQMQRERVAFGALTAGAHDVARHLTELAQPVAEAQKVVAAVSRTQSRTETQVEHTAAEVKHLRTEIEQLRATLDTALALKGDLTSLLESASGLKSLRADAEALTGQVRDLSDTFDRARQRQDELNRAGEAAGVQLHALEERQQQVQGSVAAAQTRVTGLEEGFAHLTQAAADAADTKRQLGTLKALADHVTQKVAVLEQQREVVDRALGQATQLDDVMRDIDAKIRTHEANAKSLGALETRVTELHARHGDLLAQSRDVSTRHEQIAQTDRELQGRLNELRDEVQRTVQRFELENQGLDAVGQRIGELRGTLTDMETRCRSLDESARTIGDVRSQAGGLETRLAGIADTVAQLETQGERLGAVRSDAERLAQTVDQMTQRLARLEEAQPAVDAALHDFASLKGTHAAVKDALERMRVADGEIGRVLEAQGGTKTWLSDVTQSVDALRGELAAVEGMKPAVESVRRDTDRLTHAMAQIEGRMTQTDAAVTALEARARSLDALAEQTRALGRELERQQVVLDSATEHLERAAQLRAEAASIAQRLEERAGQLNGALSGASDRTAALTTTLDDLESRAGDLRFVQRRMAQFEERLAKWHATEEQLMRALAQTAQRQATVDALQADLYRLFEVAERTVDHVRSIAGARARQARSA